MPNPFSNFVFEQRSFFSWLSYTLSQKKLFMSSTSTAQRCRGNAKSFFKIFLNRDPFSVGCPTLSLSKKKNCSLCLQLQQLKVCIARLAEMQNGDRAAADTSKALPLM
jgi:hypothetical protein